MWFEGWTQLKNHFNIITISDSSLKNGLNPFRVEGRSTSDTNVTGYFATITLSVFPEDICFYKELKKGKFTFFTFHFYCLHAVRITANSELEKLHCI